MSNLGLNRSLADDYIGAIKYYQKSYNVSDSTYHISAANLGLAYYNINEFEKGIEITTFVISKATNKATLSSAYINRALNFIEMNDCKNAESDLNYIIKNFKRIENIDFHIEDISEKLKNCLQQW